MEQDYKEKLQLNQVRQNYGVFGGVSLIFGLALALSFYKARIGINVYLFTMVMIYLLIYIMKRLSIPLKKATFAYYLGSALLGVSTMFTANYALQFLNIIGIMLLLDLSLVHQFQKDENYDFLNHMGRMFGLLFRSIASLGLPFADSFRFLKKTRVIKSNKIKNILIGALIALPILFVIVSLLSSADLLFGEITVKVYQLLFSPGLFQVTVMVLFGFVICYCILCGAVKYQTLDAPKARAKEDPMIAITTMSMITAVYLLFCGIQIMYLFANGVFVLPQEYTFAEYARRGFFELLAVTIVNIALIVICTSLFQEHKGLKIILSIMTVCTYIMILSAGYRMLLYIEAYHLTFMRLLVLLFLVIDFFVLAGVIVSVHCRKFSLFGYCVTITAVFYLIFSFSKPDAFIASYYLNHKKQIDLEDVYFLTGELSYDAAPIVIPYLSDWEKQNDHPNLTFCKDYVNELIYEEEKRGVRDINFSYWKAKDIANQFSEK